MTTEERLEKLECELARAKRHNRVLLAAAGVGLGVWIAAGTFGPAMAGAPGGAAAIKEVRASRFVVVDKNGKDRAWLSVDSEGTALFFVDENGMPSWS